MSFLLSQAVATLFKFRLGPGSGDRTGSQTYQPRDIRESDDENASDYSDRECFRHIRIDRIYSLRSLTSCKLRSADPGQHVCSEQPAECDCSYAVESEPRASAKPRPIRANHVSGS